MINGDREAETSLSLTCHEQHTIGHPHARFAMERKPVRNNGRPLVVGNNFQIVERLESLDADSLSLPVDGAGQ